MFNTIRFRWRFRWAALLLSLLLLPEMTPLAAQESSKQRIEELRERMHRAKAAAANAERAAELRDSLEDARTLKEAERLDTTMVGPFQVVTYQGDDRRAVSWISDAWDARPDWMNAIEPRLRGSVILVKGGRRFKSVYEPRVMGVMRNRPRHFLVEFRSWQLNGNQEWIANNVIGLAASALLPTDVQQWLAGLALGGSTIGGNVFREMAVAPSSAARECFAGNEARCADALVLTDAGAQWKNWYTADDLRKILLRTRASKRRPEQLRYLAALQKQPCFALRDDAACFEAFEHRPQPAPLSHPTRASFVDFLLQNDAGAAAILFDASPRLVRERLTAMAGGNLEAAADRWQDTILKTRPERVAASVATGLTTVIWMLVFAGLAMRSTRWRAR